MVEGTTFDPWQRRMRSAADRLRLLDEVRFSPQIRTIEACLQRDAQWNLAAALRCYDRCQSRPPLRATAD